MRHPLFFVGALLGGFLGAGLVQQSAGEYRDAYYGFKINPPSFPVDNVPKSRPVATFFAPSENRFNANMNINVQTPGLSLDDFASLSRAQFSTAGFEILEERRFTVGDHGAVEWTYDGRIQDRDLRFLAWAVERGDRIFLITCAGSRDSFDRYGARFRASLESFAFTR